MSDLKELSDREIQEKQVLILREISASNRSIKGWLTFIGWVLILFLIMAFVVAFNEDLNIY